MTMSPRAEDFERLAVRWASAPHASMGYPNAIAAISAFPELYLTNRDSLPQMDTDRAFALVCRACEILDDKLLFATDETEASKMTLEAIGYLDEAIKLDNDCFDAQRIRYMIENGTRDVMVSYLQEGSERVRAACTAAAREAGMEGAPGKWGMSVFQRPYLRWQYNLANEQLNCGRYGASIEICQALLDLDEKDVVGARMIAALDYVKLEDAHGLAKLIARFPDEQHNAWFDLSRLFMAYKQCRLDDAATILHQIVRTYPGAGRTLTNQDEISPGAFGRLAYEPGSADELYIAVSESAVVLDENCGTAASPLSFWIANDPVVTEAKATEEAQQQAQPHGSTSSTSPASSAPQNSDAQTPQGGQ